jgi:hypothetical protein
MNPIKIGVAIYLPYSRHTPLGIAILYDISNISLTFISENINYQIINHPINNTLAGILMLNNDPHGRT